MSGYPIICKENKVLESSQISVTSNSSNKKKLINGNIQDKWVGLNTVNQIISFSGLSDVDKFVMQKHNLKDYKLRYTTSDTKLNTCGMGDGYYAVYLWEGLDGKDYSYIDASDGSVVSGTYTHSSGIVVGNGDKISWITFEDGEIYPLCEGSGGVLCEITSGGYKNGYVSKFLEPIFWSTGNYAINWDYYSGYSTDLMNYIKNNTCRRTISNPSIPWDSWSGSASNGSNNFYSVGNYEGRFQGTGISSGFSVSILNIISDSIVNGDVIKAKIKIKSNSTGLNGTLKIGVQIIGYTTNYSNITNHDGQYYTYEVELTSNDSYPGFIFGIYYGSTTSSGDNVDITIKDVYLYKNATTEQQSQTVYTAIDSNITGSEIIPSNSTLDYDAFDNDLDLGIYVELLSVSNDSDSNKYYDFTKISTIDEMFLIVSDIQTGELLPKIGNITLTEELMTLDNVAGKGAIIPRAKSILSELSDGGYFKVFQKDNFDYKEVLQAVSSTKQQELLSVYEYNFRYPLFYIKEPLDSDWNGLANHVHWSNAQEFWNYTQDLKANGYDVKIELVASGGR